MKMAISSPIEEIRKQEKLKLERVLSMLVNVDIKRVHVNMIVSTREVEPKDGFRRFVPGSTTITIVIDELDHE